MKRVFLPVIGCLKKKWDKDEKNFVQYFKTTWLSSKHNKWFEGCVPYVPKTNNALESFNAKIKTNFQFHRRFSLYVFKDKIRQMISAMSIEYRDGVKRIATTMKYDNDLWYSALKWARSSKKVQLEHEDNNDIYYIPAGDNETIDRGSLSRYLSHSCRSFNTFSSLQFSIWKLTIPSEEAGLGNITCTCPPFMKKFICKHVMGMCLRLKLLQLPENIQLVEDYRKKRGRPRKAGPALNRE